MLRQTYRNIELIISDNASTDATHAVCTELAARDSRVRYSRNDANIGAAKNYNHVFALARGKYFKWAAHDDVLAPSFVERCVAVLEADREIVLCSSKARRIDDRGEGIGA